MDFRLLIRLRLKELGIGQNDLAIAAHVTESYVSQLLTGKKAPPSSERTDMYRRMEVLLRLPPGQLATLADVQRRDVLKRKLADPPAPLFKDVRALILRKCALETQPAIQSIFDKEPFGTLERLVTQKLLDVVKRVSTSALQDEGWLRRVAALSDRCSEDLHGVVVGLIDADIFSLSASNCITVLDPLIESWNIDLATFGMEIVLNRHLAPEPLKKIEFMEQQPGPVDPEPGLQAFLQDPALCGDVTAEEVEFLKALNVARRKPTPLYYYREIQNLRDPLHFRRGI